MITLQMIHETINQLRDRAASYHMIACNGPLEYVSALDADDNLILAREDAGPDEWLADMCAPERAECARLAMAWHDVARGCHDDLDLQMRLGEMAKAACVEEDPNAAKHRQTREKRT